MKAVILAAGKGTRMGGLTTQLPKPMLRVQGKPILEHILAGLISAGIARFLHRHRLSRRGHRRLFRRRQNNGTSTSPTAARRCRTAPAKPRKSPGNLSAATILSSLTATFWSRRPPIRTCCAVIARADYSGLVTCTGSEDVTKGGLFFFDRDFCLEKLVEKPTAAQLDELRRQGRLQPGDTAWYNAGLYIFQPLLFDFTARLEKSPRGEYELTDALTALLAAGHRLVGLEIQGRWVDVRDPQVLAALEQGEPFPQAVK